MSGNENVAFPGIADRLDDSGGSDSSGGSSGSTDSDSGGDSGDSSDGGGGGSSTDFGEELGAGQRTSGSDSGGGDSPAENDAEEERSDDSEGGGQADASPSVGGSSGGIGGGVVDDSRPETTDSGDGFEAERRADQQTDSGSGDLQDRVTAAAAARNNAADELDVDPADVEVDLDQSGDGFSATARIDTEARADTVVAQDDRLSENDVSTQDGQVGLTEQGKVSLAAAQSDRFNESDLTVRNGQVTLTDSVRDSQQRTVDAGQVSTIDMGTDQADEIAAANEQATQQSTQQDSGEPAVTAGLNVTQDEIGPGSGGQETATSPAPEGASPVEATIDAVNEFQANVADGLSPADLTGDTESQGDGADTTVTALPAELEQQLESDVNADLGAEDVSVERTTNEDGETVISAELTDQGRDTIARQNAAFSETPVIGDITGTSAVLSGRFQRDVVEPSADVAGGVTADVIETATPGVDTSELAENVRPADGDENVLEESFTGTGEGVGALGSAVIGSPNTIAGIGETGSEAVEFAVRNPREVPDATVAAGQQAAENAIQLGRENPGMVTGSLVGSSLLFRGARAVGPRTSQVTRGTIQPGEELLGLGLNRVPVVGNRLAPNNEPIFFSEEAAIRGARGLRSRVGNIDIPTRDRSLREDTSAQLQLGGRGEFDPDEVETDIAGTDETVRLEDDRDLGGARASGRQQGLEDDGGPDVGPELTTPGPDQGPDLSTPDPDQGPDLSAPDVEPSGAQSRVFNRPDDDLSPVERQLQAQEAEVEVEQTDVERTQEAQTPQLEQETTGPGADVRVQPAAGVDETAASQDLRIEAQEPDVFTDTAADITPALDTNTEVGAQPRINTEIGTQIDVETGQDVATDIETELGQELETETETETEQRQEFRRELETETETETEQRRELRRETETEIETEQRQELRRERNRAPDEEVDPVPDEENLLPPGLRGTREVVISTQEVFGDTDSDGSVDPIVDPDPVVDR